MVCTIPMVETHASALVSNDHKLREKRVRVIVDPVS